MHVRTSGTLHIHAPDREVQDARETNPGPIGNEQGPSQFGSLKERDHCGCDREPQDDDLNKGPARLVHRKEDERPGEIQQQLDTEE